MNKILDMNDFVKFGGNGKYYPPGVSIVKVNSITDETSEVINKPDEVWYGSPKNKYPDGTNPHEK